MSTSNQIYSNYYSGATQSKTDAPAGASTPEPPGTERPASAANTLALFRARRPAAAVMANAAAASARDPASEHSRPSLRLCRVERGGESGSCGFHVTRTKWDPYPWVAAVDDRSPAQAAGLLVGDCVLEVNGDDVLGLRVGHIAAKVQAARRSIALLLWNAGSDASCDAESLCCTPMPTSLSRLSSCLSSILSFLECPICFEIISPPAHQCPLGHLICFRCRVYIDRCPICRTGFTRERSLLADQIYNSIIEAFHLGDHNTSERTRKLWERVFGRRKQPRDKAPSQPSTPRLAARAFDLKNKFLTRLIGKSSSVDNLSNESAFGGGRGQLLRKKSISSAELYQPSDPAKLGSPRDSRRNSVESLPADCSAGSCETLAPRCANVQRFRARNATTSNGHDDGAESLFQFASDAAAAAGDGASDSFHCPLSEGDCEPRTAFSLLTHLQQHPGPVIQYFQPAFRVRFPFSFENGAVFIVHCYEQTFYTRLHVDESSGGDIRVYFWIMGGPAQAAQFKLSVAVRDHESGALLEFKTAPNSLRSSEPAEDVFRHQMLIAESTLRVIFGDKSYSLDLHFKKRKNRKCADA